jgi:hypothetical protein
MAQMDAVDKPVGWRLTVSTEGSPEAPQCFKSILYMKVIGIKP